MADAVVETRFLAPSRYKSLLVAAITMMAMTLGACARSPTVVMTRVSVDATVPALMQLRTTAALQSDPTQTVSNMLSSLFRGSATDRPAPYVFPMLVLVNVPPGWAGAVTITVEGLDWDTSAVNAVGSTSAQVVADHQTSAVLTLTGVVSTTSPDGGVANDAEVDGDVDADVDADSDSDAAVDADVDAEAGDDAVTDS
jgi:hypothetical protein